jgi:hypothetical protein
MEVYGSGNLEAWRYGSIKATSWKYGDMGARRYSIEVLRY